MSKFQQKAEAQTRQIIGQMLGDQLLIEEGKEQERRATEPVRDHHDHSGHDQGMEQPRDKERDARVSRVDRGGDPPGKKG